MRPQDESVGEWAVAVAVSGWIERVSGPANGSVTLSERELATEVAFVVVVIRRPASVAGDFGDSIDDDSGRASETDDATVTWKKTRLETSRKRDSFDESSQSRNAVRAAVTTRTTRNGRANAMPMLAAQPTSITGTFAPTASTP